MRRQHVPFGDEEVAVVGVIGLQGKHVLDVAGPVPDMECTGGPISRSRRASCASRGRVSVTMAAMITPGLAPTRMRAGLAGSAGHARRRLAQDIDERVD